MITKKNLQEAIDEATADIISAVVKGFEAVPTKDDLKSFVTKDDLKSTEIKLSNEIKDVKRQINDLKADTPTPQEFVYHEKRITKLEAAAFPQ